MHGNIRTFTKYDALIALNYTLYDSDLNTTSKNNATTRRSCTLEVLLIDLRENLSIQYMM